MLIKFCRTSFARTSPGQLGASHENRFLHFPYRHRCHPGVGHHPGLIPYVDQTLIGYILMAVGVIGLIASLVLASPGRSRRVSETRSVVDPNTGERIVRNESRDGGI